MPWLLKFQLPVHDPRQSDRRLLIPNNHLLITEHLSDKWLALLLVQQCGVSLLG